MSSSAVPSPFGKLLQRSKFASYDPLIGQAYTTYGGHAYRGNWGLKRPLPNRRKVGFINVQSIDSREQQTEWNSAESSARWIRRWDESGKKIQLMDTGPWHLRNAAQWSPDSEFSPISINEQNTLPLINRQLSRVPPMSSKQFNRYLERTRSIRPLFKQFLQEELKFQESRPSPDKGRPIKAFGSGEVDMYSSAQFATSSFLTKFRKQRISSHFESLDSSALIGSEPHIYAGLELTVIPPLQIRYLYGPSLGRIIARNVHATKNPTVIRDTSHKVSLAAVTGIVGEIHSPGTQMTDHEAARHGSQAGVDGLRIAHIQLADPPNVVRRKPRTAANTTFAPVDIYSTHNESNLSNPYPLGSRNYIGKYPSSYIENIGAPNLLSKYAEEGKRRTAARQKPHSASDNAKLMENLNHITKNAVIKDQ